MCGITGWVDFERDLTGEVATVQAMTSTMACRGPDEEGLWLAPHAGLGHRRLAVIDIAGGRQPMGTGARRVIDDAAGESAVITYSGEVYNFGELRAELAAKGHRFRTRGDTEVVLRGYLEWGEAVVDRLNGMYAFALWDLRRQELLLVRDRLGVKPLYYHPLPNGVLFGSEPKAILAHPLVRPAVDADGLRELLTTVRTPGRAVFDGMYELRPGHVLRVRRGGIVTRRYWGLAAREHTDDLDTTVRTIRELLDDIVRRRLVSDVPLCSLLSGGLDSAAITALAAEHGPIRSFAVDFAGYTENLQPDGSRVEADGPFVRELVRHVAPDHSDILLDAAELTDPRLRATVVRAWDQPRFLGDINTSRYLLFRAIRAHATVALSGESADEVFGGYPWFHLPRAVHADTFPWLAVTMRDHTPADLLDRDLRDQLDLPAFVADSYRSALAEVPHLPGQYGLERRMREVCYLHLTRFVRELLDRKDRMSMAVGLEVRVPYCDHRLVEYVFNTPWAMKTFDGREKSLLRAAVSDIVPESILRRTRSPCPTTQDPAYEQALRDQLSGVLRDWNAPVLPLLDRSAVRRILMGPAPKTTSTMTRYAMEMALDLNEWLRSPGLRLAI
jgi:asparagine synthase (glutamine-hydrolysing)